jgi:hypothetical protein
MAEETSQPTVDKIKLHAVSHLAPLARQATNLSIDRRVYESGEEIGPPTQRIRVTRRTIVVFADDDPRANWGHRCRYLLYDAETGELAGEIAARLPSGKLEPFYQPVKVVKIEGNPRLWGPFPWRCPVIFPDGERYALLFAGFTMNRHLNDLEFCYRTLIERWGFGPANIFVYSFDGTLNTVNPSWSGTVGPPAAWPGDGTPFQIQINGPGTPASLEAFFSMMAGKIRSNDLLFIHTNNHGDTDGSGAFLGYPGSFPSGPDVDWGAQWVNLYASTFCGWLKALPSYRALMVMMEQCGSGGFGPPVLSSSTAGLTTFAAACAAGTSSYVTDDGLWDGFAKEWIAAMASQNPDGSSLPSNPDTDGSPYTDAKDAYTFAAANDPCVNDSPNFSSSGSNAGAMTLAQPYEFSWIWCWILYSYAREQFAAVKTPQERSQYYRRLNAVVPALQRAIATSAQKSLLELRREVGPAVKEVLERASF